MLPELEQEAIRQRIARRIALEFDDGDVVNLGIGIPTLVSDFIPENIHVVFQTENGVVGAGPKPEEDDWRFIGAGGRCLSLEPGAALIASDFSFGLIRGGHLDYTVLGALQVDQEASLASWWVPGKLVPGMGGSMDLVTGVRNVIVATAHRSKKNEPKIVKKCSYPLTAVSVVSMIVTEYCVFRFLEGILTLCELAPGVAETDLRRSTDAGYVVNEPLQTMKGMEEVHP